MNDLEENAKSAYDTARELVDDLGKLGKSWVRYGIAIGEESMQRSARTLDETARALRKAADRLRVG